MIYVNPVQVDIKFVNGRVLDGTGAAEMLKDVCVKGMRIAHIGDASHIAADLTIDINGKILCPGFIDVHSHSDTYILFEPEAPSKIFQGVTTEIVGNCGGSAAPRYGQCRMPVDWQEKTYPGKWHSVAEYRKLLEEVRPALNIAHLAGHNTIRGSVMGYGARRANSDDVRKMVKLLEQSMEEGSCGLSTGLIYQPGLYAEPEEIHALAAVVGRCQGLFTSHMRSEGDDILNAIRETAAFGLQHNGRVEISHLKVSGKRNWHKIDDVLSLMRELVDTGLVAADRYPYTAAMTDLDIILPDWVTAGEREEILKRLADKEVRQNVLAELRASRPEYSDYDHIVIGGVAGSELETCSGKRLTEVADEMGLDPAAAALELICAAKLNVAGIFHGMSDQNMWRILAEPYVMIGSDGSLRSVTGPLSREATHPRNYGTFPKLLRASIDGKTVPLPEMIRKMTSLPASHFQLRDRGLIRKGFYADLAVFDPSIVCDRSTYGNPHQYAEGIDWVLVNGAVTLASGMIQPDRKGCFLEHRQNR